MAVKRKKKKIKLYDFIWQAYYKTVIIPLLLIEVLLVMSYFAANNWVKNEMSVHVMEQADTQLNEAARLQAELINVQLHGVANDTVLLSEAMSRALQQPAQLTEKDQKRLAYSPSGEFFTTQDTGGISVYYNGIVPVEEEQRQKVARVLTLETFIESVAKRNDLIAASYFFSHDGLITYYPYLDPATRFVPEFDITQYNFYYETGPEYNPEREVRWTTAYGSFSGLGYMISAVAPVYIGDNMEGIYCSDILVSHITKQIEEMETPWGGYAILIGDGGNAMAVPKQGRADWGIDVPTSMPPNWASALERRIDINSTEFADLVPQITASETGFSKITVRGEPRVVAWNTVAETGWKLLVVVCEKKMYEKVYTVSEGVERVGLFLLGISVLFFVIFTEVQRLRCEGFSKKASTSLLELNRLIKRIAQGDYYQKAPEAQTIEIEETLKLVAETGWRLGDTNKSLILMNNEIRQKEAYLKAALSSVDDFLLEAGRDGADLHPVVAGPKAETEEFERLLHWLGTIGTPVERRTIAAINQVIDTGEPMLMDFEIPTRYGKRWYISRLARIDVEPPRVIISVRDNTKRIEMEHSIIRARDAAEAASRAKSQFLSNMSHELRTPLNAILGFAQILEMDGAGKLTTVQREYVGEIISAGQHLLGLINGVLDLARIESGKLRVTVGAVNVRSVVDETVTIVTPFAEKNRVTVHVSPAPSLVIQTDRTRLKQVLLNLLTNAIKYNKPGGSVHYSCTVEGEIIRFHIKDTGIGIRKEEMNEIFSPFTRLERSSEIVEGTGVGLAIVRQLVQLLGGRIHVESTLGEGSIFTVVLPLYLKQMEERKPVKEKKILHLTSNRESRLAVARTLRQRPDVQYTAAVAEDGILRMKAFSPRLVLVDYPAPEIPPELLGDMMKTAKENNIAIVAVISQETQRAQALQEGFSATVTMPVTERAIMQLFESI
jgi:signal transduction histidine kinase